MGHRFSWLAGAIGIGLALLRMERLLRPTEEGPAWEFALLAGALLGVVITWTAMSYRIGTLGTALLNLGGLVLAAFRLGAPHTLVLGILPSLDTFSTVGSELGFAIDLIRFGAAPVPAAAGLILILTVVFWVLGALLAWGLLAGRPTVALLPPLLFYLQIATIDRIPPRAGWTTAFLAVTAFTLLAVALDERSVTAGRLRQSDVTQQIPMSSPLFPSVFVAATVLVAVLGTSIAQGLVPLSGFLDWRARTGLGGGIFTGVSFNLFANITQVDLVSRSEEPVFIAQVEGDVDPRDLYWKLITLETFDGDNWFPGSVPTRDRDEGEPWEDPEHAFLGESVPVSQTIRIETLRQTVLPVLHSPRSVNSNSALLNQSFRVRADGSVPVGLRTWDDLTYEVESAVPVPDPGVLASQPGQRDRLSPIFQEAANAGLFTFAPRPPPSLQRPGDIGDYLELPDSLSPLLQTEAVSLTESGSTPFEKALILEAWFRDPNEFSYSIDIDPGHSASDLADWLFTTESPNYRTGYCEQFATAMAAMARTLSIPSRVVLGFTPGEQTADGQIVVRGKNAHAWVELWMDGQGWVRFDPTPRGDGVNPSTANGAVAVGFDPRNYIPDPTQITGQAIPPSPSGIENEGDPFAGEDPIGSSGLDAGSAGGPGLEITVSRVVLLAAAALVGSIPLIKWIRRRRRLARLEHGDITGAWDEIVDRLADLGRPPTTDQTPLEVAASVHRSMEPLALSVSEVAYGPGRPLAKATVERAADSFARTEAYLRDIHRPFNRMRAWLRWRSLDWRNRS